MAELTCTGTTFSSIQICVTGLDIKYPDADRTVHYTCNGAPKPTASVNLPATVSSGGAHTFTGLLSSTPYTISCYIHVGNASGSGGAYDVYLPSITVWTDAPPIRVGYSVGENYISAYVFGLDTTYSYGDRKCQWYLNGATWGEAVTIIDGYSTGGNITIYGSGVCPSTSYTLRAIVTVPYGETVTEVYDFGTVYPRTTATRCVAWSWTSSNGTATAAETSAAYYALVNRTATSNFSYKVWNDLVDKVAAVRAIKGIPSAQSPWSSVYLTQAATKMTASDRTLTATRYNSLKYNIGSIFATGISDVVAGQQVSGQNHILSLTNLINIWIDIR